MIRRTLALAAIALSLGLVPAARAAEPGGETLYRASATAVAVHGFYDHEGLFPVPILNVSVPHTEASFEPGPSSQALGSFLWDPQAAELGTILCVLSEGQLCDVPEYPFQARASYPRAGPQPAPPTLSLDDPASPVAVRAAHERASAGPRGAAAEADVASLGAVPMTPPQTSAARSLAASLGAARTTPWLIEVANASARSSVTSSARGAVSEARTVLHGVELLGGLVTADAIRGEAVSSIEGEPHGRARATIVGLRVGDVRAEAGPNGIRLTGAPPQGSPARPILEALNDALAAAGLEISDGVERVRRSGDAVSAEAFALSLDLEASALPEQLPEGTQGRDVLHVPLGFASTSAGVARIVTAPPPPGAPSQGGGPGSLGGALAGTDPGAAVGGTGPPAVGPPPVAAPGEETTGVDPVAAVFALPVPTAAILGIVGVALLLALGLTWLKVNEVLNG